MTLFSRESFRRHWSGLLWLLPYPVIGIIYDLRRLAECVRVPHSPGERPYEYHLTPLTAFLGDTLFWLFWGGIALFLVQAVWQCKDGVIWFLAKVVFVPVWLVLQFFLFFHVE